MTFPSLQIGCIRGALGDHVTKQKQGVIDEDMWPTAYGHLLPKPFLLQTPRQVGYKLKRISQSV